MTFNLEQRRSLWPPWQPWNCPKSSMVWHIPASGHWICFCLTAIATWSDGREYYNQPIAFWLAGVKWALSPCRDAVLLCDLGWVWTSGWIHISHLLRDKICTGTFPAAALALWNEAALKCGWLPPWFWRTLIIFFRLWPRMVGSLCEFCSWIYLLGFYLLSYLSFASLFLNCIVLYFFLLYCKSPIVVWNWMVSKLIKSIVCIYLIRFSSRSE